MPSAKQHTNELLRLKNQTQACRLRLMGLTEAEIGRRLNVHEGTISRWISEERETRRAERDITRHEMQAHEAEKMELVQREAWRGWFRSLRDQVEETIVGVVDKHAEGKANEETEPAKVTTKRKCQSGNPGHLAQIIRASERIAALFGLDEPPAPKEAAMGAQEAEMEVVETIVETTEEANRLRDQHLVVVRSTAIQPIRHPDAIGATPP
jgi:transposase